MNWPGIDLASTRWGHKLTALAPVRHLKNWLSFSLRKNFPCLVLFCTVIHGVTSLNVVFSGAQKQTRVIHWQVNRSLCRRDTVPGPWQLGYKRYSPVLWMNLGNAICEASLVMRKCFTAITLMFKLIIRFVEFI